MSKLLARIHIRLHALAVAFLVALPVLLDKLGTIDLHPVLASIGLKPEWADLIIALVPFYLAFLKPLIHVEDANDPA